MRACRGVLWTQAALAAFSGIFVLLVTRLYGIEGSIPVGAWQLAGWAAVLLGGAYLTAAALLMVLAAALGATRPWAVRGTLAVEVVLALLTVLRASDVITAAIVPLGLCVAATALVLTPATRRAAGDAPRGR